MKGIIYIMTTAVEGIIKIGKTGTGKYQERMRHLKANGYYNVVGLKEFFAIELKGYEDKESLLQEIFREHQVGAGELFALAPEVVKQLLLAFEGNLVFPKDRDREKEFNNVSKFRKLSAQFSFYRKGLKNGDEICFIDDKKITAKVCGEREVEYEGQRWKLSPLALNIYEQKGKSNKSKAYQGAAHFEYKGKKLKDLPDIV